jgi:hypothetical protein
VYNQFILLKFMGILTTVYRRLGVSFLLVHWIMVLVWDASIIQLMIKGVGLL